jgi:hypothetical protein
MGRGGRQGASIVDAVVVMARKRMIANPRASTIVSRAATGTCAKARDCVFARSVEIKYGGAAAESPVIAIVIAIIVQMTSRTRCSAFASVYDNKMFKMERGSVELIASTEPHGYPNL